MFTNQTVAYLRNTLTLADDLTQFDINIQLTQAKIEHLDYQIVELDSFTERQQLIFTGYQLGAITAREAYAGAWWAYDHCIVIFTVLPDGSTKTELVSNLNSLQKIKEEHVVGSQLHDLITHHEYLTVHGPDGTFYPAVYTQNPQNYAFVDDGINSYIELRNQVFMNEIDTGTQMIGLYVAQHDGEPNLMFCGEQIASDISFKNQIDLYRTIGGKFICHIQTTRFFGRIEHQAEVFTENDKPTCLNRKLKKELDSYMDSLKKDESFSFRQKRMLMN